MNVDSYLELFTTLFGWAFYGVLWDVLVGSPDISPGRQAAGYCPSIDAQNRLGFPYF